MPCCYNRPQSFKAAFTAVDATGAIRKLALCIEGVIGIPQSSNGGVRAGGNPPKFAETSGLAPGKTRTLQPFG